MQDLQLLKKLIEIDRNADQPLYLQITNAFIRNIRRGRLRTGLRLPGSRKVGDLLNINRMTVVAAYDELQAQGWIERIPRKGTFVKHDLPEIKPKSFAPDKEIGHFPKKASFPIDRNKLMPFPSSDFHKAHTLIIDNGFPDTRLTPIEPLIRHMRGLYKTPVFKKYLEYGGSLGTTVLRETLSNYLNDTRGLPILTENIMITRGAQMGINLAAGLLIEPGDPIIVGEPGYLNANLTFKKHGARINRVPVDDNGIDIDAVERVCKNKRIKLIYVIPHHHFPTTVTLTPRRRIRLLELAETYGFAIIEDDYDYDFHYASSPILPMASLDQHGSVIYIGTLTKTLAPAVRIGFTAGAKNYIQAVSNLRKAIDWQGDSLLEIAVAELYKDGTMSRHIKKSVKTYRERRDHFCNLLETELGNHLSFDIPDGGMSVWATFTNTDLKKISREAYNKDLVISDGQEYNTHNKNYNSARMGFASLNLDEQQKAVDILRKILN